MRNKLKIHNKDTKERQRRRSGVSIINFTYSSHLFLAFLFWTLSIYLFAWTPANILVEGQKLKHRSNVWNLFKVNNKDTRQNDVDDVVLLSLLLTWNRFHTLIWCFYCWLWTSKCQLGHIYSCCNILEIDSPNAGCCWHFGIAHCISSLLPVTFITQYHLKYYVKKTGSSNSKMLLINAFENSYKFWNKA